MGPVVSRARHPLSAGYYTIRLPCPDMVHQGLRLLSRPPEGLWRLLVTPVTLHFKQRPNRLMWPAKGP
jgi:hypothetical protein